MDKNKEFEKLAKNRIKATDDKDEIKSILIEYNGIELSPTVLGIAFEKLFINENFSDEILVDDLIKIHPDFRTKNGSTWNRENVSYLGKKYNIKNKKKSNKLYSVTIEGANKRITINQSIRADILKEIKNQRCAILDIGSQIECDHKDGQKNTQSVGDKETQKISDFQPLCKTANDAKRSHCKLCKESGKRYDATRLGYSVPFTYGDENTKVCQGCYWYDPKAFNAKISENYHK